jgi:nitric oxide dioxygenase
MLQTQKDLVKATLPALQEHGEAITRLFYKQLLEAHPEVAPMFATGDQENGRQAQRLAAAILAYAGNIDRLDVLGPAVSQISHRHVRTHVLPEHYPIVGQHLLAAIHSVLGDAATPEILDAWGAAYGELAEIMIAREQAIYAQGRSPAAK